MKALLRQWPHLMPCLAHAKRILLLTDYDGTLTPIVRTPRQAALSKTMRSCLRRLSKLTHVRVGVISGRILEDVKSLVGLPQLIYVGNHGFELKGPGLSFVHPKARNFRRTLRRLLPRLEKTLQDIPGAILEWKILTASLHWRTVPRRLQPRFHRRIRALFNPYLKKGSLRLTRGKCVAELRPPVQWDKGKIILWLLRHMATWKGRPRPFVIYLGDDRTDEDAFLVVNRLRGLSIFVGNRARRTRATYWLKDSDEVSAWLMAFLKSQT